MMACKWLACCPQDVRDIFFTGAQLQVDPSGKMCSVAGDDFEATFGFFGQGIKENHGHSKLATFRFETLAEKHRPLKSQGKRKQGSSLGHSHDMLKVSESCEAEAKSDLRKGGAIL